MVLRSVGMANAVMVNAAMVATPHHQWSSACSASLPTRACASVSSSARLVARAAINSAVPDYDCSVPGFEEEDGMFEDLFPAPILTEDESEAEDEVAESSGLIPQEWKSVQEELSKTKKQRKRETLDLLERRARERQERERMLLVKQIAGREVYKQKFFPRVLPDDMTTGASDDEDGPLVPEETPDVSVPVKRATPKNPRAVLGNSTFEDMTRMLSVGKLGESQPPAEESKKSDDVENMEVLGSKLLTAEEKALLKINEVNFARITSRKWNPLHTFAASGQINQLDLLLRRGSDVNAQDMDGFTALHWAAACGGARDAILRYLLKSEALITAVDKDGATVLHHATRVANSFAIKAMLRHNADINARDNEGWTPLHIAVQGGRTDLVNLLVARGADPTIRNQDGNTPVDMALSYGKEFKFFEVVKLLKNSMKGMASQLTVDELVEQPRPAGINLEDTTDENLESFKLMTEEEMDRFRTATLDLSTITSKKWNPLHAVSGSGQINHVDLLLRHGIDVNARDMDGLTELHWAAICGRDGIVRYLLKRGADAKAVDKDGVSALHYATRSANTFAIKALLRRNANVNACDNDGWTPLHIAVQSGRLDVIKLLLSKGADVSIKNKNGNTPLDVALSYGKGFLYYHVVKLLKKGMLRSSDDKRPDLAF
ncbi:hypothetical protein M758_3G067000 [Ceratodon purpureus]|uniref:Uncharacterized protein n=1 Tax=Ceratodon purpureus TaxID=3225 RepID=A0A8T0IFN7_CERPU|nr:hypothetical protein KC19_3G067600 [Ceratodon purpureus]KAG0622041.1 hypothetical protein M758_3G067000 [Ceratodon purpureus]